MSIEQEARKDLTLGFEEAENILGGKKKAVKLAHKAATPAAKTYPVAYINVPASTGGPIDDSGTTAWSEDCADPTDGSSA